MANDLPVVLVWFGAFGFGYLCYDLTHYACHQLRLPGKVGRYIERHHLTHHYADSRRNFGVTSPIWDWVFGTLRKSLKQRQRRVYRRGG